MHRYIFRADGLVLWTCVSMSPLITPFLDIDEWRWPFVYPRFIFALDGSHGTRSRSTSFLSLHRASCFLSDFVHRPDLDWYMFGCLGLAVSFSVHVRFFHLSVSFDMLSSMPWTKSKKKKEEKDVWMYRVRVSVFLWTRRGRVCPRDLYEQPGS